MFKFNNNHVFTGYLKQLLASFHLPKCRVYTKELEQQQTDYLSIQNLLKDLHETQEQIQTNLQELDTLIKEALENDSNEYEDLVDIQSAYQAENSRLSVKIAGLQNQLPKIIPTTYHSKYFVYPNTIPNDQQPKYPTMMRYAPYIKDGCLQVYTDGTWHNCHASFSNNSNHAIFHKHTKTPYASIPYTYGQKILNYTKNLQIQNTVYDSYTHEYLGDYLRFHRDFANIDLMPLYNCFSNRACPHLNISFEIGNNYEVKFKTDQSFETALYKYYMVPVKFFKDYTIAIDSSASIEVCCCIYDESHNKDADFSNIPKLTYQCFGDLQFKTPVLYTKLQNLNGLLLDPLNKTNDLCQQENNLKLILKIPANNASSIVILEGDYTTYNDSLTNTVNIVNEDTQQTKTVTKTIRNKTIINYENLDACETLEKRLITPLQLLRSNTGESYPFADRLIEYLVGNAITINEEIKDNVVRAKKIISTNCHPRVANIVAEDGIWEPILSCLVYDYINEKQNIHDINHDILGFIDKDVEKWYATGLETISSIDIYNK